MVCSPIKVVRELGSERKLHCVLHQQWCKINLTKIGEALLWFFELPKRGIPRVSQKVDDKGRIGVHFRFFGWRRMHNAPIGIQA